MKKCVICLVSQFGSCVFDLIHCTSEEAKRSPECDNVNTAASFQFAVLDHFEFLGAYGDA